MPVLIDEPTWIRDVTFPTVGLHSPMPPFSHPNLDLDGELKALPIYASGTTKSLDEQINQPEAEKQKEEIKNKNGEGQPRPNVSEIYKKNPINEHQLNSRKRTASMPKIAIIATEYESH